MFETESETQEHKLSLNQWREVVETVAAMASAGGGCISIGIDPSGRPVGVQLGNRSLEQLADQIKTNTDPPQFPSIMQTTGAVATIVTVKVDESPVKPVWAFGRPMKRVGRTNQRLSREAAQRLQEATTGRTWDALPCPELSQADLDAGRIQRFLSRAGRTILTPPTSS